MAQKTKTSANLGFEEKLWTAADKLRGSMDASDYKYVVLGLIFLKYISDTFEEAFLKIKNDPESYPDQWEDKDAYKADNVFWVPQEARWGFLKDNAKKAEIGELIDAAMLSIERENPSLKGVLMTNYARPTLDKRVLGELVDLVSDISLGDAESKKRDILGRVFEYFLGKFANAEGKAGGEFYTPRSIVRLLVSMLEPYEGRVFDPCCGSGGMFVQSEEFVREHNGRIGDISVFGQERNNTTWKLCKMNLAIRGIESDIRWNSEGSFHNDAFKDLKADFILANPPFNDGDWGGELLKNDLRWKYGVPPNGNGNYAWIQHFIHHLSPTGIAGFVLANGSLSSNTSGEGEIRKSLIKAGLVDCIVSLPGQLFYTTQIPASLWFVSRDRYDHKFRDRHNEILFIDARNMGKMVDRSHKELREEDLEKISGIYHSWRSPGGKYEDQLGFVKSVSIEDVEKASFVLTPGRFVGSEVEAEDATGYAEKMESLVSELNSLFDESSKLQQMVKVNLKKIIHQDER